LGGLEALNFYQEIPKSVFHFAYVNTLRSYIINKIENLFNTTEVQHYGWEGIEKRLYKD